MPELPEVETTRRGIARHVVGKRVSGIIIRQPLLRWRIPAQLQRELPGQRINSVERRGKYLLFRADRGTLILHLGMSGSLAVVFAGRPAGKHDHVDIVLEGRRCLRLTDPRRFGSLHWTHKNPLEHWLLSDLGPEPLGKELTAGYLFEHSRGRRVAIKQFLMNGRIVAGFGNIYANEALFLAGIHPGRAAGHIALRRYERLVAAMKRVLQESLAQGGTTLRDFSNGEGRPGYFKQHLRVYGLAGEACKDCGTIIRQLRQSQRATYYCPRCQR